MRSATTVAISSAVTSTLRINRIAATPVRMVVEQRGQRHGAGVSQRRAGILGPTGLVRVVSGIKVPIAY
jgi:hypothetical protein